MLKKKSNPKTNTLKTFKNKQQKKYKNKNNVLKNYINFKIPTYVYSDSHFFSQYWEEQNGTYSIFTMCDFLSAISDQCTNELFVIYLEWPLIY